VRRRAAAPAMVRRVTDRPTERTSARPQVPEPRFVQADLPAAGDAAAELRAGLLRPAAAIPPRFFYDDLGSRLFAAITALDEYYPTRTEAALLQQHLPAIAAALPVAGGTLIDLGAGTCEKAARVFPHVRPHHYVAVDISVDFLRTTLACLQREHPGITMLGVGTDFSRRLLLPREAPRGRRVVLYAGSSIGNFTPAEAVPFLRSVHDELGDDGALWIGVDLVKETAVLERAYDDTLGVTAAFNKNVLRHANRLAGTDFDVADWRHVARYDAGEHRIEMHLEAVRAVTVRWPGGARRFAAGERIHTENSYKYTPGGFERLLAAAGLATHGRFTDERGWFGFFVAGRGSTARRSS
jgi:L-histidine Nalpha-methyltransferase